MPLSHRLLTTILFPALLMSSRTSAQQTNDLATQRAQHRARAITTSVWFAKPSDYSAERLRTFTSPDDIRLIHQLGFDHIRLSIDADPLLAWQRTQPNGTAFMEELDAIVKLAIEQKLAVIIDLHPQSRYKQSLLQGDESVQRFAMLWRA